MSHFVVPDWHINHLRQEQIQGEESNSSSHVHKHLQNYPTAHLVPMSDYEIAELTWENGQLAMHGLGGTVNSGQTKPTWGRTCETLESIVHQATSHKEKLNLRQEEPQTLPNNGSIDPADSEGKWANTSSEHDTQMGPLVMKKKCTPLDSDQCPRGFNGGSKDEQVNRSASASASATICRDGDNDIDTGTRTWASFQSPRSFTDKTTAKGSVNLCRDNDTTVMTWSSYQSPQSLKTISTDEDSACQGVSVKQKKFKDENQDEDRETKTRRRSRAAAIHNQSERKRRDRINQKMKALQKLVPSANKTDKASILDEVIKYLKQLQAQVQMMTVRRMPQMMMPMGTQQQIQMSLLQRMGMGVGLGMGMGMLDMSTMAPSPLQSLPHLMHSTQPVTAANPAFVSQPFVVPQMFAAHSSTRTNPDTATNASMPLPDPYTSFLAQQMNMDLYNKMAALHQQQVNQSTQATRNPSQSNHHLQAI